MQTGLSNFIFFYIQNSNHSSEVSADVPFANTSAACSVVPVTSSDGYASVSSTDSDTCVAVSSAVSVICSVAS